jgi:HEAT repeat protein
MKNAVLLLVGLVAGYLLGSLSGGGREARSARERSVVADDERAELRRELAARDAEIRELKKRTAKATPSTDQPAFGMGGSKTKKTLDLEKARTAAVAAGVSDEELDAARALYDALLNNADPQVKQEATDKLDALGARKTAAVAALLRGVSAGTLGGREIRRLMRAAFVEGQEGHLIDAVRDSVTPGWTKSAVLRNFDLVDTPAARDYLVQRLGAEEDRYVFCDTAMALGQMKEPRAVESLARALERGDDWKPFHPYVLHALAAIGDAGAEGVLVTYIRRGPAKLTDAFRALHKVNPDAARGEAAALLAKGARNETERATLRKYAER